MTRNHRNQPPARPLRTLLLGITLLTVGAASVWGSGAHASDASDNTAAEQWERHELLDIFDEEFLVSNGAFGSTSEGLTAIALDERSGDVRVLTGPGNTLEKVPLTIEGTITSLEWGGTERAGLHAIWLNQQEILGPIDEVQLRHASSDDGWQANTIHQPLPMASEPRIDGLVIQQEQAHALVQIGQQADLRLFTQTDDGWTQQALGDTSKPADIVADENGNLQICYQSGATLIHLNGTPGEGWNRSVVLYDGTSGCSLATDGAGTPHVVYARSEGSALDENPSRPVLGHAVRGPAGWEHERIPLDFPSGGHPTFDTETDGSGNLYVGFYHASGEDSSSGVTSTRNGTWSLEDLDPFGAVSGPELEPRSDGSPPFVGLHRAELPYWKWEESS